MFLVLAQQLFKDEFHENSGDWPKAVNMLFRYRALDLQRYMEQFWAVEPDKMVDEYHWAEPDVRRSMAEPCRIGQPPGVNGTGGVIGDQEYNRPAVPSISEKALAPPKKQAWKHLIYSYLIESTRIEQVFRRVLQEIFHGESLGRPTEAVLRWAHLTERLVFSDRDGHWLNPPISEIRPDPGAIRRNAYYRLFGMDLSHGLEDGRPYPYVKPEAANRDFGLTFETLLREVWRAYVNRDNKTGARPTDDARMSDLCTRLENMLRVRRHAGALSQHEFYCDAIMSWFHVTVSADNDVIYWLQAQAHDEATRLKAVGDRVGVPVHNHSYEFFEMAEYLQEILYRIEGGDFSRPETVTELYGGKDDQQQKEKQTAAKMIMIINHWSTATGRNLKEFAGLVEPSRATMAAARTLSALAPPKVTSSQPFPPRIVNGSLVNTGSR